MNKYEFLEGLKKALASTNNPGLINENYEFYRNYIEEKLKKQRSEEEIMEELGDPRLIANSIKEAAGLDDEFAHTEETKTFYGTYDENGTQTQAEEEEYGKVRNFSVSGAKARWTLFAISAVLIIILILLIGLIGSLLYIFAPVIIAVIVVMWLVHIFRR